MTTPSPKLPIGFGTTSALKKGALISIARPRAMSVECVHGLLWITHDNEPHDIMLSAGQRHVATSNARMIVQGMQRSALRIQMPQRRHLALPEREVWGKMSALLTSLFPARETSSALR